MATTVEVMVEAFRDAGTPFIVGHPGGESVEMMDAARVRGMRFILMKQETAGAILQLLPSVTPFDIGVACPVHRQLPDHASQDGLRITKLRAWQQSRRL